MAKCLVATTDIIAESSHGQAKIKRLTFHRSLPFLRRDGPPLFQVRNLNWRQSIDEYSGRATSYIHDGVFNKSNSRALTQFCPENKNPSGRLAAEGLSFVVRILDTSGAVSQVAADAEAATTGADRRRAFLVRSRSPVNSIIAFCPASPRRTPAIRTTRV